MQVHAFSGRAVEAMHNVFMSTKFIIKPAKSPSAVGPYNHGVRVGDLLFCAGQIPIDPATGNLVTGDIKAQTERVLENVKAILDDQQLTFSNVAKTTVFLTDLGDFASMNEVYSRYFTADYPARSTIQVAALPKGASVEIEIVAHY
jgi:2-iminobutanoate/2-iminopropanoate deaminase